MPPKILIVDDHEVVREGVKTLIKRSRPQWVICGEAKNAQEAIQASRTLQPDVTVLDVFENAASAKIVASDWVDYLHLARWNGEWKIVNVLWELKPQETHAQKQK